MSIITFFLSSLASLWHLSEWRRARRVSWVDAVLIDADHNAQTRRDELNHASATVEAAARKLDIPSSASASRGVSTRASGSGEPGLSAPQIDVCMQHRAFRLKNPTQERRARLQSGSRRSRVAGPMQVRRGLSRPYAIGILRVAVSMRAVRRLARTRRTGLPSPSARCRASRRRSARGGLNRGSGSPLFHAAVRRSSEESGRGRSRTKLSRSTTNIGVGVTSNTRRMNRSLRRASSPLLTARYRTRSSQPNTKHSRNHSIAHAQSPNSFSVFSTAKLPRGAEKKCAACAAPTRTTARASARPPPSTEWEAVRELGARRWRSG